MSRQRFPKTHEASTRCLALQTPAGVDPRVSGVAAGVATPAARFISSLSREPSFHLPIGVLRLRVV